MNRVVKNMLSMGFIHVNGMICAPRAGSGFWSIAGAVAGWFFVVAAAAEPVVIDLRATAADGTIYLERVKSLGGVALAAGDLDGTGIDEIIIGSPFAEGERGRVDIIYNPPVDTVPVAWDLAAHPAGLQVATIIGRKRNDWFGHSVAVGDYNNDGRGDLAVGAPNAMDSILKRPLAGTVSVFLGGYDSLLPGRRDAKSADIILHGAGENDGVGLELVFGDLTGDGVEDLVISAPFGNVKKTWRYVERAYISYGSSGHQPGQVIDLANQYDVLLLHGGALVYGSLNSNAYTIRDIIGDSVPDLIVGRQYSRDEYGYVHILRGGPRPPGTVLDLQTEADFVIQDSYWRDWLGSGVGVGDVDGDGDTDLVVGGSGAFSRQYGKLVLFLFTGKPDPPNLVRVRVGEVTPFFEQVIVRGADRRERLGQGLVVGDCTGDGVDDIAVGAVYGRDQTRDQIRGRVYVLFGRPSWPSGLIGIDDVPDVMTIVGARKSDDLGLALSLGWFSGGLSLLASAWQGDGPGDSRANCGEVYLFSPRLLASWAGPVTVTPSGKAGLGARDLYLFSRSWRDQAGDGAVGSEDLLRFYRDRLN